MTTEEKREDAKIDALAALLERLPEVRKHNEQEDTQADIMAFGLIDIAEEADDLRAMVEHLRRDDLTDEQRLELLKDIGESLRHIDYHIHDMAFYDEYVDEVEQ